MGLFDKLDALIDKLDEPIIQIENISENDNELSSLEDNTQPDIIDDGNIPNAEIEAQNTSSEDAQNEAFEKLAHIAEKQQEQIASLNAQIAALIKGGANVNDGKESEVVAPAKDVPEEYVPLKELDFSI